MVPLVIMTGADKGGVGKTTVSRALLDYLQARKVVPRVFDTESPGGDLVRFAPAAQIVDMNEVADQMRVFDVAEGVTVVDVRAGMMSPILSALDQVNLLDDVRKGAMKLVLLHVLGPTPTSLNEIGEAARMIGGGAAHFIVKNNIDKDSFAEWDKAPTYAALLRDAAPRTIDVPQLVKPARDAIQLNGLSFAGFARDPQQSRMLRGYVLAWLGAVWRDFDKVGLGAMVDQLVGDHGDEGSAQ